MIIVIPYQGLESAILYDKAIITGYRDVPKFIDSDIHYSSKYCTFLTSTEFGTLLENNRLLEPFIFEDMNIGLSRVDPKGNHVTLVPPEAVYSIAEMYNDYTICMLDLPDLKEVYANDGLNILPIDIYNKESMKQYEDYLCEVYYDDYT